MFINKMRYLLLACTIFMGKTIAEAQQLPYKNKNLPIQERVSDLLGRMTIDEKIAQIRHIHSGQIFSGQELVKESLVKTVNDLPWGFVEGFPLTGANCRKNMRLIQEHMVKNTRLGIPIFTVAESLHGVVHEGSVIYPQNVAMGSTFNPHLAYLKASAISEDLHAEGMKQVLAPCIDAVRELRWGRVEESYGEDPWLCGLYGIAEVKGYMNHGISPMLKHYGPHGGPSGGLNLASVQCGTRDFHDFYMKPFEMVLTNTDILAVMSTYNSWNHVPNSASHYLLTDILRDKFGFKGYVYSDWGSISLLQGFHHIAANEKEAGFKAITAGLDVEASSYCYPLLKELIAEGKMDEKVLDLAVSRVLYAKFALGLFEDPYGDKYSDCKMHNEKNVKLSKQIADESTVLLKNDNNLLPLDAGKLKSIAVIGPNADQVQFGDYTWSRSNKDGVTPLQGIRNKVGKNITINYAKGCDLVTLNTEGIKEAVEAAKKSDVALVFCGSASAALARDYNSSTCGEGFDLHDINLTGVQEQMIKEIHATGKPVVLVLVTGRPFAIPWEKDNIPAILVQWYAGEQSGTSISDILFGEVSPSGHLTYSFPRSTGHLPAYYNHLPSDKGLYHQHGKYGAPGRDYVFESPNSLWAFGHGLTYTTFEYKDLKTDKEKYAPGDVINATVSVTNTGKRTAKEVVQLYVRDVCSSVVTPVKQLRAFNKVEIKPGETQTVKLNVAVNDLYILDEQGNKIVEPGEFELQVGASSENILHKKTIVVGDFKQEKPKVTECIIAKKSTRNITVKGEIRDMQSNPVSNVEIIARGTNKVVGKADKHGNYKIKVGNQETLIFRKKGYIDATLQVDNNKILNVTIKNDN